MCFIVSSSIDRRWEASAFKLHDFWVECSLHNSAKLQPVFVLFPVCQYQAFSFGPPTAPKSWCRDLIVMNAQPSLCFFLASSFYLNYPISLRLPFVSGLLPFFMYALLFCFLQYLAGDCLVAGPKSVLFLPHSPLLLLFLLQPRFILLYILSAHQPCLTLPCLAIGHSAFD